MRKTKLFRDLTDSLGMSLWALKQKHNDMRLSLDRNDLGAGDTLRYNVLTDVLDENYDRAIATIEEFKNKPSPYPQFHARVERLLNYSIDVICAIRAKKSFTGLSHLTMAKQKEFVDKFKQHIIELKAIMTKIELIEHKVKLQDARSSVIFIRACWYSLVILVVGGFIIFSGDATTKNIAIVFEDSIVAVSEMIWR
jgi:hypothetical protein